MRAVRSSALYLLIGVLPALLLFSGSRLLFEYLAGQQRQDTWETMARRTRSLQDDVLTARYLQPLIRDLDQDLSRSTTDTDAVSMIQQWGNRYPDLSRIYLFKAEPGVSVKLLAPVAPQFQAVWRMFGNLLARQSGRGLEVRGEARLRLIHRQLLDGGVTAEYIASRPARMITITHQGRDAEIYWNHCQNKGGTLLYLIVFDREARERHFSPAYLAGLAPPSGTAPSIRLQAVFFRTPEDTLPWQQRCPSLRERLLPGLRLPLVGEGEGSLYQFQPVRAEDGLVFVASISENDWLPGGRSLLRFARFLALAWALISLSAVLLLHTRRWQPFLPVRLQLVCLFLLAILPPVAALFSFGLNYLRDREIVAREEALQTIRGRIQHTEDLIHSTNSGLRDTAFELLQRPELKGKAGSSEVDLAGLRPILDDLIKRFIVERAFILDSSGQYLLQTHAHDPHPLEATLFPRLAQALVEYQNDGKYSRESLQESSGGSDSLRTMFLSNRYDLADQLIRNSGTIHHFRLLHYNYSVFFHPVRDAAGRTWGAIGLFFDLNMMAHITLSRLVVTESSGSGETRLFYRQDIGTDRHGPRDLTSTGVIEDFIRRLQTENAVLDDTVVLDGEPMLAWGRPLKELDNTVIGGLYPGRRVDESVRQTMVLFTVIIFFSLAVAVTVAGLLSRRIIAPVAALNAGVKAVAGGHLDQPVQQNTHDEFGLLADSFNEMVSSLREKERMSRYVSEFVRDAVKHDGETVTGCGETVEATILFSDLRGFTTLSEQLEPSSLVGLLNEYLEAMTEAIQAHGGVVDKFIGDAVMAVFTSSGKEAEDHPQQAVAAALAMVQSLQDLNHSLAGRNLPPLANGVGIHVDQVIRGSVGSRRHRMDLTVLGDGVNLAARLESLSKTGEETCIFISGEVADRLRDRSFLLDRGSQQVKGRQSLVQVYELSRQAILR